MTQNEKAARVRQEVERMEQERVMVHGIEVKPGQVWECSVGGPSCIVSVGSARAYEPILVCEIDNRDDTTEWSPVEFADAHPHLVGHEASTAPAAEPGRWTDAEFAAEQVALARRQADAARAEARELRAELVEAHRAHRESCDASLPIEAERDKLRAIVESDRALAGEASEAWAVLTGRDVHDGRPEGSCVTEARRVVAERDKARADLDHLHVGTIDHERMVALEAQLAETRAALEAARAAVHTPSPGGSDGPWSPPVLTLAEARALLDEGSEVGRAVRKRLDRMERAIGEAKPGGTDPATRTRALPELDRCGECRHINRSTRDDGRGDSCGHPDGRKMSVERHRAPPECCPIAELAKAGGA